MIKNSKTTTSTKPTNSSKRLPSAIKGPGIDDLRTELNRYKAEIVCLRSKFNVEEIAKNRIIEWSTEQMFQQSLINAEIELKKFQDSSGDALRDHNSKLTRENSELKKSTKYQQEEITVLKHRCKSLDMECQQLRVENETKQRQVLDTKDYNAALEEIKQLRETVKEKEEQLVQHLVEQQNRATLQSQYDELVKDLSRERAKRQTIEESLREQLQDNQKLAQDETIKQIEKERDANAKEVDSLRVEIETMRASFASQKTSDEEKKFIESKLAETKSQLQSVQAEMDKLRDSHLAETDKLKATLNKSKLEKEAIQAELDTWKASSQSLAVENTELKIQLQEKSPDNIDLSPELKELKEKYEIEKSAHVRTKSLKEELEIRCHDAFEKINQKEKMLKALEDKHKEVIARKDKTIAELRKDKTMVNPVSDRSQQELQAMREKLEYAMKEMRDIKTEYDMLKKLRD